MRINSDFIGRKIVIATMHKKEQVIAPLFENLLGVSCFVSDKIDTDIFGTFSGEKERLDDPLTVARKKCELAMSLTNLEMGIASEGSFGPHPYLYFIPANEELLYFIDKKNGIEIYERIISTETNFSGKEIHTEEELMNFAHEVKFPSHGIIIKKSKNDLEQLRKGIVEWNELKEAYHFFKNELGSVFAETDMRAMYKPSRMKVIESVTLKLIDKINSKCPDCNFPGFGVTGSFSGLPCEVCGLPSKSILYTVFVCLKCNHTEKKMFPLGKEKENPMYCDFCNP